MLPLCAIMFATVILNKHLTFVGRFWNSQTELLSFHETIASVKVDGTEFLIGGLADHMQQPASVQNDLCLDFLQLNPSVLF